MEDSEKSKLIGKKLTKKIHLASKETSEDSAFDINRGYKRRQSFEEISTESNQSSGEQCDEYINRVRLETRKK